MAKPKFRYDYPRPALTVDIAVFAIEGGALKVLLIERKKDPFAGNWALPGGFVEEGEAMDQAALRELKEETGLVLRSPVGFVGIYGKKGRDPRGWTISVAHAAVTRLPRKPVKGGDDARDAEWLPVNTLADRLAFDHDEILNDARRWLSGEVAIGRAGLELLPPTFDRDQVKQMLALTSVNSRVDHWLRKARRSAT